jgi:aspartyl aminopeptidase
MLQNLFNLEGKVMNHSIKNRNETAVIEGLMHFIDQSPSAYQAVDNVKNILEDAGYKAYQENECLKLSPGSKGYVIRNSSSIIAFHVPENFSFQSNEDEEVLSGFHMVCAHSDSPCFKLKENPEMTVEHQYKKLNVEKYGGMIMNSWLDRPLSVAGRIVVSKLGKLTEKLIDINQDFFIIPSLAIHMTRGTKDAEINPQKDLLPLCGDGMTEESFYELLAQSAGVNKEEILGADLFLYNRQKSSRVGMRKEFVTAPRLDDLQCVYAGVHGLLHAKESENGYINILGVFDNEEVGSLTRQGADSDFLQCTLANIVEGLGLFPGDYRRMLSKSFLISADNAHALHPNHQEVADPTNKPLINRGIVIKYHGSQKYTTDAFTGAFVKQICKENDIPYQTYHNRSDIAGGSTLGNIALGKVSVPAADIGNPQLSMHSAYETAGACDTVHMERFMTAYYSL